MFYCPLHNWSSYEKPCPACHQTVTASTTTGGGISQREMDEWLSKLPQKPEQIIKEPERIEVMVWKSWSQLPAEVLVIGTKPLKAISEEKFPAIKQAIERVLNNMTDWTSMQGVEVEPLFKYTQSDMDKAIEYAFNAARELGGSWKLPKTEFAAHKYPTLQSYLNSLKK